ncbi:MAG: DUF2189 domain-containing protein [Alphaproteobacteria bacterium]|jgi:uncharacterized membrane protein|nr:DUF2189 domain-containing protein [Alphaproteobacteria bacterium]|tara:strand:+ start:1365 stop:2159 length:795 start_codon:yes stop_codon:yes gene_type:complete
MAVKKVVAHAGAAHSGSDVRAITTADLWDALGKGIADFNAKPTHLLFLGIIYPIMMVILARAYAGYDFLPLVFPIVAGSTLLGPLAACGMYELSRRREQGLEVSWLNCFDVLRSPSILAIAMIGVVLAAIFLAWLVTAQGIYAYYFGTALPASIGAFVEQIFTTPPGWSLILVGSGVGFLFSIVVLTISVVSIPMLLDRQVDWMTAIMASIRSVLANPSTMAVWGLIVAASLIIGALPLFVGLAVVMPILGHATWHLYRKVVVH